VEVLGGSMRVKVGFRQGRIVQATPEYEDAAALARAAGVPVTRVLTLAAAAAVPAGLVAGRPWPQDAAI
jgi:uncharacterized protein (DUF111 family)